ncbi:hypothetical protein J6590_051600 [Homalodisca vitripennis]|nr:hypothetical protein J6590_051600 [Homalodisca vitripennis]
MSKKIFDSVSTFCGAATSAPLKQSEGPGPTLNVQLYSYYITLVGIPLKHPKCKLLPHQHLYTPRRSHFTLSDRAGWDAHADIELLCGINPLTDTHLILQILRN